MWLILETSGRTGRVGLARDGALLRAAALDDTRRHARDLAATVGRLLAEESIKAKELTGVMVGRGPGSYTGLRVGIMSGKALAYAAGCQMAAVDTFAAIAAQTPAAAGQVWVIADALQNQVYAQPFERSTDGKWARTDKLRILRVEDWLAGLSSDAWVTGPGVKVYADRIPPTSPLVSEPGRDPQVESVYQVGRDLTPLSRIELFALEPLYLRGSSAEEKAKAEGAVKLG